MRRDPRTTPSPRNGRRRFFAALAALVAVLSDTLASLPAAAQDTTGGTDDSAVRIVARKLSDGRVEFALQQRSGSTWGDRQLPRTRFFPTTARVGRWLVSSPLDVTAPQSARRWTAVTAGNQHSCGLRADGTVTCWGYDSDGETDAPDGQFTAVSAGSYFTCGVRSNGTITCWGLGQLSDAPDGRFTAVSAGGAHSCGLRTNGTITCWGDRHNTDVPD